MYHLYMVIVVYTYSSLSAIRTCTWIRKLKLIAHVSLSELLNPTAKLNERKSKVDNDDEDISGAGSNSDRPEEPNTKKCKLKIAICIYNIRLRRNRTPGVFTDVRVESQDNKKHRYRLLKLFIIWFSTSIFFFQLFSLLVESIFFTLSSNSNCKCLLLSFYCINVNFLHNEVVYKNLS